MSSTGTTNSGDPQPKTNKFEEKLQYNVDRFAKILLDEQQQQASDDDAFLKWLQDSYGIEKTQQLQHDQQQPHELSTTEIKSRFKEFLKWFRREFPYYRDTCEHCGAKGCQYQGTQLPTTIERQCAPGLIDSTEVSLCPSCHQLSRFPRYLSALEIARRKKGRCSEYSLLLYRILRVLGWKARWIVDWANHVWAEVWIENDNQRWIHLDPCEASVDEPLLYQGWGKKQTYIVAFSEGNHEPSNNTEDSTTFPRSVVDVTQNYTSNTLEVIQARRTEDGVTQEDVVLALQRANTDLKRKTISELISGYQKS